ncbi:MAG: sigma 54 response regulatory protein [uncultured bacterium]|nr:MAG: sigma 54 response regulatory protein [uncultured bacterium]
MKKHTILIVDDEPNILKSLQRLFEDSDYEILSSENGFEGLTLLQKNNVSLIISDYRMPEMDGIALLKKASEISPSTVRIMLTGFADINTIIRSINLGEIFRFIVKPWNDDELQETVTSCLAYHDMVSNYHRLDNNYNELQRKNDNILKFYKILDNNFHESIKFSFNLITELFPSLSLHLSNVAKLSVLTAKKMNLNPTDIRDIEYGALFHDLGKISFSGDNVFKPDSELTQDQIKLNRNHPVTGSAMISSMDKLKTVSNIILQHHENIDGSGFPYGRKKDEIHHFAQIVSAANFYDHLTNPAITSSPMNVQTAITEIKSKINTMFDPNIISHLEKVLT